MQRFHVPSTLLGAGALWAFGLAGPLAPAPQQLTNEQLRILSHLSYDADDTGVVTIRLSGANLQLVNGEGRTDSTNGNGNLILGYNEPNGGSREGSHNLVVGRQHTYSSYGGIVSGLANSLVGNDCTILSSLLTDVGGVNNVVAGGYIHYMEDSTAGSVILGGDNGRITDFTRDSVLVAPLASEILGGSASCVSICGDGDVIDGASRSANFAGTLNTIHGSSNVAILAGLRNEIRGGVAYAAIVGGEGNLIDSGTDWGQVIVGGEGNYVDSQNATVIGGQDNVASHEHAVVLGGQANAAAGQHAVVSGGQDNTAMGPFSVVGGGLNRLAPAIHDWVAGSLFEEN